MRATARGGALLGALLLIIVTLGFGGTASADPGNSNGNDNGNGNGAQNAQAASGSSATGSSSAGSSAGGTSSPKKSSASTGAGKGSAKADHSRGNAGTSGTWNDRQPNSGADDNPGGANGQCSSYEGVYCSTRDGSASENGNNVGKASGRPCAGCVGKADNKNPQGQKADAKTDGNMSNGKGNNGYECDGNNGIAKGNPAHTMCQPGSNVVETCPDGSPLPAGGRDACSPPPPPGCPEGQVLVDGTCTPPCPAGQELVNGTCAEVEGEETVVPPLPGVAGVDDFAPRPQPNAEVLGVQATAGAPAVLPATGSSAGMGLLTAAGFVLLAAGAALAMRRRLV